MRRISEKVGRARCRGEYRSWVNLAAFRKRAEGMPNPVVSQRGGMDAGARELMSLCENEKDSRRATPEFEASCFRR